MFKTIFSKSDLTPVEVDVSAETFVKYGFPNLRHGDRVKDPYGFPCVIQGFGLLPMTNRVALWYIRDGELEASYCNKDTKEEKFTPIKEEEK